jgi:hypothetical protein
MAINSIPCPVLDAHVTRVTDLEGNTTRIICTEYERSNGACRLRKTACEGGSLEQLLGRVFEGTLSSRGIQCVLRET